ncbi:hypothetical protein SCP_1600200 [Sparassis crispa]|uniref:Uncharacterized protein n=1 Tax=Sparassis crispa TaxID=139825 RepID=A0A401H4Q4_9APHY|nr:hypothetical protein SCP_1600200 [Sparassis crispa]GBE89359.1 hypothetical protein SCP_1600200 [Sparassis crispa]
MIRHFENFIEAAPCISDALASLEKLEDFFLIGCCERVREMLPRLRSKPRRAMLVCFQPLVLRLSALSALQHAYRLMLSNIPIDDNSPPSELRVPWEALNQVPKLRATLLLEIDIVVPASASMGAPSSSPLRTVDYIRLNASRVNIDTPEAGVVRALRPLQCIPPVVLSLKVRADLMLAFWERPAALLLFIR